jgi:membrane associated rhomboid family serine protease
MEYEWTYVSFIIITLNLAVFLFTVDLSKWPFPVSDKIVDMFGLAPQDLFLKPYTLITHMFVHADIIHFYGNIFMLAIIGMVVEPKIGHVKFFLVYLLSGLCAIPFGFFMQYMIRTSVILIGASGAIFGTMVLAGIVAGWEEIWGFLIPVINFIIIPIDLFTLKNIKVPMFVAILFYFLENLILTLVDMPYSIGELAHFGGIFGGILAFVFVLPEELKKKTSEESDIEREV